jgi:succinate dehydrogenase / fumarate reductase cytochrome b subunit
MVQRVGEEGLTTYRPFAMKDSRKPRPVFLNLATIQLPVGALTSIAHRFTGVLLAAGVPFCLYLLDLSLQGTAGYARAAALLDDPWAKAALISLTWALAHHLLAGIRHMLSDFDIGSQLYAARRMAWMANAGGVAVVLLVAAALL